MKTKTFKCKYCEEKVERAHNYALGHSCFNCKKALKESHRIEKKFTNLVQTS